MISTLIAGAANPHINGYMRSKGQGQFHFAAVADHSKERLQNARKFLAEEAQYFSSWREMFDRFPHAEAVIIGTDNCEHLEVFREAVERKLHIYMMKVISMDEKECRTMLELEKGYEKVIQVEFELHFRPQFLYAKKLIESGKLGKLKSIYLSNISQSPCNYFPNWGTPELSYGRKMPIKPGSPVCRGGGLTDHPHPYDMIRWLTGKEFKTVFAVSSRNQRTHLAVEDNVVVSGTLTDGTAYMINPSYAHLEERVPERRLIWPKALECKLKLTGERGYFSCDFDQFPMFACGSGFASPNRYMLTSWPEVLAAKNLNMLNCFYECITGKRQKPESVLNDSYQAVRVMNAAYESIYRNAVVTL